MSTILVLHHEPLTFVLAGAGFDVAFGCDEDGVMILKAGGVLRASRAMLIPCLPNNSVFNRNIMHPKYLIQCLQGKHYGWNIDVKFVSDFFYY